MTVKDATMIRMGFYPTGIQTIKDLLAQNDGERVPGGEALASKIESLQSPQGNGFISVRLSVSEWERISDAFLECGNDHWEASIASEINETLHNHGWR